MIPPEVLGFANKVLAAGGKVETVKEQIAEDFDVDVNSKFLFNLRQQEKGTIARNKKMKEHINLPVDCD